MHSESAAWLLGAAAAQHAFLGIELRHNETGDHAEVVSATRARLGAAFDKAWPAGQAATVDEAVVAALEYTGCKSAPEFWRIPQHGQCARNFGPCECDLRVLPGH